MINNLRLLVAYLLLFGVRSVCGWSSIVTGANGYVGRAIVHELLERYRDEGTHQIVCLVRASRVDQEKIYWGAHDCVKVASYDMTDGGRSFQDALQSCSGKICVYHVASVFGPTDDHEQSALDNVKGTRDLCQSLGEYSEADKRLVMTSSTAAIRGTGQDPGNGKYYTHEDWNTQSQLGANWGSSYQWSKAESERVAKSLCDELGISLTTICPSFVFGPPNDPSTSNSYALTLVNQWARGESPVQSRLFVDVRDVAAAHVLAAASPTAVGKRYIVSHEARVSSEEIADWLRQGNAKYADKIHYDGDFTGGAIPIGSKEVDAIDRLEKELGLKLRPVKETITDMAKVLLAT